MKAALLVIDAQELITTPELYMFDRFVSNVTSLIDTARKYGTEVIYVRHDDGADKPLSKGKAGYDVYGAFKPLEAEMVFDKTVNSPFKESGLLQYLNGKGIGTLIVTGLQTDYCIDATVKCGFEHGFGMIIPEYANSTYDNKYMTAEKTYEYYNCFMWKKRYAECVSVEEAEDIMKRRE